IHRFAGALRFALGATSTKTLDRDSRATGAGAWSGAAAGLLALTSRARSLLAILDPLLRSVWRNCLRCSRVRNAELLLPKETTPSAWFPRMRQHYVSFCVQESSSPSNKFRQGPRQPHRNWWSHEILARAPKILGEGKNFTLLTAGATGRQNQTRLFASL